MSGMPAIDALLLLASVIALVIAAQRRIHPFLALVLVACAFGLSRGFSVSFIGKMFGYGFSEMVYSPGLAIVAAALVSGLAEVTSAAERLAKRIERWRAKFGSAAIASMLGAVAGIGASPAAAFALLTPLVPAVAGTASSRRPSVALALALTISASHGLVLLSPVPIAASAILGADWRHVALLGLPVALLVVAFSAALVRWLPIAQEAPNPLPHERDAGPEVRSNRFAIALALAVAVPVLLLIVQSLGDIPSEPFGGGSARERLLGLGRPLVLLVVSVGIMAAGLWRQSFKYITDSAWTGRVFGNVAGLLLTVGAAGGLQRLCQETGMAELLGERLLGLPGGLVIPFLVAAAIKTLQGSSLVAAITAAGMVQPYLTPLGLGDANGRALAALAVGAGAMTICHVNDAYFWLVADRCGLSPLRALGAISVGTLLQGLAALVALLIASALIAAF